MDRITKDTLSTYNTGIRSSHLQKIYRSDCMKLSCTFSGDRGWYALEPKLICWHVAMRAVVQEAADKLIAMHRRLYRV